MIKGENQPDTSSCSAIKPIPACDPTDHMYIVRNPNYDPKTDTPQMRENFLDGVSITIDKNNEDIFEKIEAGELDGSWASHVPNTTLQQYVSDPAKRKLLHSDPSDEVDYLSLNLLTPPFDDIYVRKAVNYVLDKAAMQQAIGGPIEADIATHVFPASMIADFPPYDPYASTGHRGDVAAAKREMEQSRYDHDHDGVCDDPVCRNVVMITRNDPPYAQQDVIVQQ